MSTVHPPLSNGTRRALWELDSSDLENRVDNLLDAAHRSSVVERIEVAHVPCMSARVAGKVVTVFEPIWALLAIDPLELLKRLRSKHVVKALNKTVRVKGKGSRCKGGR